MEKFYSGFINEYDSNVKKTKYDYPYSYDGFIVNRLAPNSEANNTIYSDKFNIFNKEKYKKLKEKYFPNDGDYWPVNNEPLVIQNFLREFFDNKDLKLVFIMEYCNLTTGYPYWRFDFYAEFNY